MLSNHNNTNYQTFTNNTVTNKPTAKKNTKKKQTAILPTTAKMPSVSTNDTSASLPAKLEKDIAALRLFIETLEHEINSTPIWKLRKAEKYLLIWTLICWAISLPLMVTSGKDSGKASGPGLYFGILAVSFTTSLVVHFWPGKKRVHWDSLATFSEAVQTSAQAVNIRLDNLSLNSLNIAKVLLQRKTNKYNELVPKIVISSEMPPEDLASPLTNASVLSSEDNVSRTKKSGGNLDSPFSSDSDSSDEVSSESGSSRSSDQNDVSTQEDVPTIDALSVGDHLPSLSPNEPNASVHQVYSSI